MMSDWTIRIKMLENGYSVEVPDKEMIDKKMKENGKSKYPSVSPYMGDCTKTYAAKSAGEVMKLVKKAISALPEHEYKASFAEAVKEG